jgi:polysaccharide biosynthesis/export protein
MRVAKPHESAGLNASPSTPSSDVADDCMASARQIPMQKNSGLSVLSAAMFLAMLAGLLCPLASQGQTPGSSPTGDSMGASQSSSSTSTPGYQAGPPASNQSLALSTVGLGDGPIIAGDTVEVQVFDAPEFSVRALVSQSGDIPVPLLKTFHIAGLTSIEAAAALAKEFKDRDYLQNPSILVTVQQSANGITVLGEVRAPGIYPAVGKHRLSDVLARAGGPNENAAHVVEITGPEASETQRVIWDPTFQENPAIHVFLQAGQTVLVGRCGVVYLGGNLNRPGAYPLCGSRHTTLSEAVALAGGTRPSSYSSKTVLLRIEQGTRTVRVIDIEQVLHGKSPDFTLMSDDIVYVPTSALKAGLKTISAAALSFAATVGAFKLQQ